MEPVYIVAVKRTPLGSFKGGLSSMDVTDLGAHAVGAVLKNTGRSFLPDLGSTLIQASRRPRSSNYTWVT